MLLPLPKRASIYLHGSFFSNVLTIKLKSRIRFCPGNKASNTALWPTCTGEKDEPLYTWNTTGHGSVLMYPENICMQAGKD